MIALAVIGVGRLRAPASASSARTAASLDVPDVALGVDQILGRPVLVLPGVPGAVAVVLDDRVADPV
jgi:hypothetical protein